MKKNLIHPFLCSLFLVSFTSLKAQDGLPTNPVPGKCYAKCLEKDEFKDSVVKIMEKPSYKVLKVIPAKYEKKLDSFLVKPEVRKYVCTEPIIIKVKEKIYYKDPYHKISIQPATFKSSTTKILTSPSIERWEMGGKAPDCKSIDPNDCRLIWYKKYPEQYENIPISVLNTEPSKTSKEIKFDYKEVEKEVISVPSKCSEVLVSPAVYEKIEKEVLVKDETVEEVTVPAVYKTTTIKKLVKKGGLTVWREVECDFLTGKVLPILYDLNDARLTPEAQKIINDNLLTMLINEPLVNVEISSHTDSRGDAEKNLILSQKRAQSVVDYLVQRGIDKSRLTAKGYGETALLNECKDGVECSDEKHALNRRTEFKIIQ